MARTVRPWATCGAILPSSSDEQGHLASPAAADIPGQASQHVQDGPEVRMLLRLSEPHAHAQRFKALGLDGNDGIGLVRYAGLSLPLDIPYLVIHQQADESQELWLR